MSETAARIHLQGIGSALAVPAAEIRAGDRLMWNFGSVSTVVAVEEASPKFLRITERAEDGKDYTRRFRKDRAVARVA